VNDDSRTVADAAKQSTTQQWVLDPATIPVVDPPDTPRTVADRKDDMTEYYAQLAERAGWTIDDVDPDEVMLQAVIAWQRREIGFGVFHSIAKVYVAEVAEVGQ
jgi:hypothetical protein